MYEIIVRTKDSEKINTLYSPSLPDAYRIAEEAAEANQGYATIFEDFLVIRQYRYGFGHVNAYNKFGDPTLEDQESQ